MKRFFNAFVLTLVCLFGAYGTLSAQTEGSGVVVDLTYNGGSARFVEADCFFAGTAGWGGSFTSDFCAPVVWAKDLVGNDSLACDSIAAGSLAGKVVVIRRGACEFGLKALNAQKAGALAVIIVNHFATASQTNCTQLFMGSGAVGTQDTIPILGGSRDMGATLDNAIKAGNAQICFSLPRMTGPFIAYQYATPVSQVDSLGAIAVTFTNRSTNPATNVVLKCDVKGPNGKVVATTSLTIPEVAPNADTFAIFPAILPPAVKGKFEAVFSNNIFTASRDTVRRYFEHTDYTFAVDNLVIDPLGVGFRVNADFANNGFYTQYGSLYWTGKNGAAATYATFGISNADSLYVPGGEEANDVLVTLYDADVDGDGTGNLNESFEDLTDAIVGVGTYTLTGDEAVDQIVDAALEDVSTSEKKVALKPNHPYYISLTYDGTLAGHSRSLFFSNTLQEEYLLVNSLLATPFYTKLDGGTLYSGWAGATVINRLQLDGYTPISSTKNPKLDISKVKISPNPAVDFVNVQLNLDAPGRVAVTLVDQAGRVVNTIAQRDFQTGNLQIDTKSLATGTYLAWIRTSEGYHIQKIAVIRK
jgi:hypothetical protein